VTWWSASWFMGLAFILAIMSAQGGAPRSVLEGNIPAPAPVQSAPLPLQSTPAQSPAQTPPTSQPQQPNR